MSELSLEDLYLARLVLGTGMEILELSGVLLPFGFHDIEVLECLRSQAERVK